MKSGPKAPERTLSTHAVDNLDKVHLYSCAWKTGQHKCTGRSYQTSEQLFKHLRDDHANLHPSIKYRERCGWEGCRHVMYASTRMESHLRIHTDEWPACIDCGQGIDTTIQTLLEHTESCTTAGKNRTTSHEKCPMEIVDCTAPNPCKKGTATRSRYSLKLGIQLKLNRDPTYVCLDSGAGASLVDENFLTASLPNIRRHELHSPQDFTGVGPVGVHIIHYVELGLYIPVFVGESLQLAHITHVFLISPHLQPFKMLIGTDIQDLASIVIDSGKCQVTIGKCRNAIAVFTSTTRIEWDIDGSELERWKQLTPSDVIRGGHEADESRVANGEGQHSEDSQTKDDHIEDSQLEVLECTMDQSARDGHPSAI